MATAPSKVLNVTITRPFEDVYPFLASLENFQQWASGLGALRRQIATNEWLADTLAGEPVRIRLVPRNDYGIADHYIIPEEGEEIYIPMRAIRNGSGTDVIFTLFKNDMSDEQFFADERHVLKDLMALKKLLES